MNIIIRSSFACIVVASVAVAASSKSQKRLTVERVAEFTAPAGAPSPKAYRVEISGLGAATLPAEKPEGVIELGKLLRYPIEFEPPKAATGHPSVVPLTPTAFEATHMGWTIRLSAKPHGRLVAVSGAADYVESEMLAGGYGAVAGPIYNETGAVVTPNKLDQPRLQTTTTRFQLFAVPGDSYEVTFHRGAKAQKHSITVTAE